MLTRRRLLAMRDRWVRDLAVLEEAFPGLDLTQHADCEAETVRNLATAIAEIELVIAKVTPLNSRHRALASGGDNG